MSVNAIVYGSSLYIIMQFCVFQLFGLQIYKKNAIAKKT